MYYHLGNHYGKIGHRQVFQRWGDNDFEPFLKIGVTLANFHSVCKLIGYILVRTDFADFVNMSVSEGETILAAIFNNLPGILSRPVAFFSSMF